MNFTLKSTLRILTSVILLLGFSWQGVAKTFIYLSFKKNQDVLAATVCVNKNKPKSCCAAKCYLDKEIKQEEKRQADTLPGIKDKAEKAELLSGYITYYFFRNDFIQQLVFTQVPGYKGTYHNVIFHPPCLV